MLSFLEILAEVAGAWFMSNPEVEGKTASWLDRWLLPLIVLAGLGLLVVLAVAAFR